jgi:hypothetical protein
MHRHASRVAFAGAMFAPSCLRNQLCALQSTSTLVHIPRSDNCRHNVQKSCPRSRGARADSDLSAGLRRRSLRKPPTPASSIALKRVGEGGHACHFARKTKNNKPHGRKSRNNALSEPRR